MEGYKIRIKKTNSKEWVWGEYIAAGKTYEDAFKSYYYSHKVKFLTFSIFNERLPTDIDSSKEWVEMINSNINYFKDIIEIQLYFYEQAYWSTEDISKCCLMMHFKPNKHLNNLGVKKFCLNSKIYNPIIPTNKYSDI